MLGEILIKLGFSVTAYELIAMVTEMETCPSGL